MRRKNDYLRRGPRPAGPAVSTSPQVTPPHDVPPPEVDVTSPEDLLSFPCPNCHRAFASKIGLGVHRRKAHPAIVNEEIDLPGVKRRWSTEELRLMAREEALAVQRGVRFINQHLMAIVPGRTLEAIKGARRGQAYRALVAAAAEDILVSSSSGGGESFLSAEATSPSSSPIGSSTPLTGYIGGPAQAVVSPLASMSLLGQYCEDISSAIRGLIPVVRNLRGWEANNLSQIAQECLDGADVSDRLSPWFASVFPPQAAASHSPQLQRRRTVPSGKKAQRRREYARIQRLFRANMSWAAREILDCTGDSSTAVPDVRLMANHWGPYVSQASKPASPGQSPRPKPELAHLWQPVSCEEVAASTLPLSSAPGPDGVGVRQWRALPTSLRALFFNIVLAVGGFPPTLLMSRTVFVPKKTGSDSPSDYRPISITSVAVRHLHKILASRLRASRLVDQRERHGEG